MNNDDTSKRGNVVFDTSAVSILQMMMDAPGGSALENASSKSASVKFMITIQDERDLAALGYGQEQINRLKPQEVEEIIRRGLYNKELLDS